jgi:4-hydroxybenzoate polyprenyltransferase
VALNLELTDLDLRANARSYLDNVRMQDWGGYVGIAILGYLQGIGTTNATSVGYVNFFVYLLTVALYLGFSFSVNNCFDHQGDKLGAKIALNPVASGKISISGGIAFSILLALSGLVLTGAMFSIGSLTVYAVMLLLSGSYSAPPFRLKSVPVLDMASHGFFFGSLMILYGVLVTGGFNAFTLPLLLSVYNLSLILELRNQIDDIEEDSAMNLNTTVVRIGFERANTLFYGLIALHMVILVYIVNLLGNLALTSLTTVFFVGMAIYFYMLPNRDRFLLLMERVTPLVYILFLISLAL